MAGGKQVEHDPFATGTPVEHDPFAKHEPDVASYVPTDVAEGKPSTIDKNRFVEAISGGKSNNWEQFLFNNELPEDTTLGQIGQLIEGSGIQGLQGIGPIAETPALATAIGSKIPSIAETFPKATASVAKTGRLVKRDIIQPTLKAIQPAIDAISDIPASALSFMSNDVKPEAYKVMYNLAKENNPNLNAEYKLAQQFRLPEPSEAIYNYSRKFGLPHDWAVKAEHMNSEEADMGTWWLKQKYKEATGIPKNLQSDYPFAWAGATPEQKLALARNAGVDSAKWKPYPKRTGKDLSDVLHDAWNASKYVGDVLTPHAWPALVLKSPRVAGMVATGAGHAVRLAPEVAKVIPPILKSLPVTQTLGAIGTANEGLKEAKGGMIPMSLRDVHYHRLHRQRQG